MNKKYHNFGYRALMGLEAQLDKQDKLELGNSSKRSNYKNSSFKQPNSSPAHTLANKKHLLNRNNITQMLFVWGNSKINTLFNPQELCKHSNYCRVKYLISFCNPQTCQTNKYYDRYKTKLEGI